MKYNTRKWVKPEDLNPNNSLFGGRLLEWKYIFGIEM